MFSSVLISAFTIIVISQPSAQLPRRNKDELLNWCLNATLHKESPGKEDALHSQCTPWSEHACCTPETTKRIHDSDMHNFNLNHCYNETKRNISDECRKYFNQDNCFYECEPHIGLWVVKTNRRIASERFQNVPLCASECNAWFDACKDDYTCVFNWPRNFKFKKGVNTCPPNSKCQTIESVYETAEKFCENVWDNSWKVVPDDLPCMQTWFSDPLNSPNKKVAEFYIKVELGGGSISTCSICLLLFSFLLTFCSASMN